jgi:hypothetical protein
MRARAHCCRVDRCAVLGSAVVRKEVLQAHTLSDGPTRAPPPQQRMYGRTCSATSRPCNCATLNTGGSSTRSPQPAAQSKSCSQNLQPVAAPRTGHHAQVGTPRVSYHNPARTSLVPRHRKQALEASSCPVPAASQNDLPRGRLH